MTLVISYNDSRNKESLSSYVGILECIFYCVFYFGFQRLHHLLSSRLPQHPLLSCADSAAFLGLECIPFWDLSSRDLAFIHSLEISSNQHLCEKDVGFFFKISLHLLESVYGGQKQVDTGQG